MNAFHLTFLLGALLLGLSLSGCVVANEGPNYAYGTPTIFLPPVVVQGRGYGYWYGGNFWGYRNGYGFSNGHYYHHNGDYGRGYGYGRGYNGYRGN